MLSNLAFEFDHLALQSAGTLSDSITPQYEKSLIRPAKKRLSQSRQKLAARDADVFRRHGKIYDFSLHSWGAYGSAAKARRQGKMTRAEANKGTIRE